MTASEQEQTVERIQDILINKIGDTADLNEKKSIIARKEAERQEEQEEPSITETFYGLKITGGRVTTPRGTHRVLEGGLDAARAAGLGLCYSHNEYSIVARDNRAFAILTEQEEQEEHF